MYTISKNKPARHRDCSYYDMVTIDDGRPARLIDGEEYVLCRLSRDDNWWIVANHENGPAPDIGPFIELDNALVEFILRGKTI